MPAAIPGARVIEIADAGHLWALEQPVALAPAVGSIRTA
jgi:hypothetical protein